MNGQDRFQHIVGDLFGQTDVDVITNPVNCRGTMGAGLARQFALRYPRMERDYKRLCRKREIAPGRVYLYRINRTADPRYICLFPTKDHWRDDSTLELIRTGMDDLLLQMHHKGLKRVAIPALGCGLGGLDMAAVVGVVGECVKALGYGLTVRMVVHPGDVRQS